MTLAEYTANNTAFNRAIGMTKKRAIVGMVRALNEAQDGIYKDARRFVQDPPKTGRIYKNPDGSLHQASRRGESPANRTGTLRSSIVKTRTGGRGLQSSGSLALSRQVSAGSQKVGYAATLEGNLGRPYMSRALNKHMPLFRDGLRESVFRAMTRAATANK